MDIISPQEELAALMALHRWYEAMGVDDAVSELPRDYFAEKLRPPEPEVQQIQSGAGSRDAPVELPRDAFSRPSFAPSPEPRAPEPRAAESRIPPQSLSATSLNPEAALADAALRAESSSNLAELRAALDSFEGASVRRAAIQLVFGRGEPNSRVMVIGETPDSDDDKSGEAFSGLRGVFLNRVLASIGLEKNAYLTHLVPWRPAGNAMPSSHDLEACLPFAHRHIALVRPKALICLGWSAAKLQVSNKLLYTQGELSIPVLILPELNELMRSGARKRKAWEDLLGFKRLTS